MRKLLIVGLLLFLNLPFLVLAQEPDPLPTSSSPLMSQRGCQRSEDISYSNFRINDGTGFDFCGQKIDLTTRERQMKLQRELALISRSFDVLMQRASYYFPIIEPILEANRIPDDFKYLMVIESAMNPKARSKAGAAGIWQFMPATACDYGLVVNKKVDERFHIEKATAAACRYLNDAHRKFGDWVAAAQSYNIGQTCIGNELAKQQVDESLDLNLVEETNRYIYRIFAAKMIFTNTEWPRSDTDLSYFEKLNTVIGHH